MATIGMNGCCGRAMIVWDATRGEECPACSWPASERRFGVALSTAVFLFLCSGPTSILGSSKDRDKKRGVDDELLL